ncbi:hypothetical protein L6452_29280 [Arctium lappa]|uniref:Uncharacterized protein n=1 Tax=Arctium lappa TaxID=4217 RepID=A0ACB8ZG23_ARCLA|nr:hypothetical protein L6452_29280 [Arctium lappa]
MSISAFVNQWRSGEDDTVPRGTIMKNPREAKIIGLRALLGIYCKDKLALEDSTYLSMYLVEDPSLMDLQGLLLYLVAQHLQRHPHYTPLGCANDSLSMNNIGRMFQFENVLLLLNRFSSVTACFFMELNTHWIDTNGARSENLSIINGMRHLKLGHIKDHLQWLFAEGHLIGEGHLSMVIYKGALRNLNGVIGSFVAFSQNRADVIHNRRVAMFLLSSLAAWKFHNAVPVLAHHSVSYFPFSSFYWSADFGKGCKSKGDSRVGIENKRLPKPLLEGLSGSRLGHENNQL